MNSLTTEDTTEVDILHVVFGDSDEEEADSLCKSSGGSDDEEANTSSLHHSQEAHNETVWEEIEAISGLWMCSSFLNPQQQKSLVASIESEGWFDDSSHNQAMRFGNLPKWALSLCELIQQAICCVNVKCNICYSSTICSHESQKGSPLSPDLLWREPLFNQMIVNAYQPGEGICAHADLLKFEDGIAIVSLESECVMHFTHQDILNKDGKGEETVDLKSKVPVLLKPGDLLIMYGEARYHWLHEINRKPGFQIWKGREIQQGRRISVTLRRLSEME